MCPALFTCLEWLAVQCFTNSWQDSEALGIYNARWPLCSLLASVNLLLDIGLQHVYPECHPHAKLVWEVLQV